MSDIKEIREALNARAESVARQLLPHGRAHGGLWVASNPRVAGDDRKVPALKVRIAGGDVGAWTDHRNGRSGHAGDLIGLIAMCQATDTKGALAWARDFLGLRQMSRAEREAMRFAAAAAQKRQAAEAERRRRGHLDWAAKTFALAARGGPAEAHGLAYLAARKMPPEKIASFGWDNFAFSPATEWWKGAIWRTEASGRRTRVADGPRYPAIHAAMRGPTGALCCCHVTFLDPLAPAKAPVEPPKLMAGLAQGAVIEVSTGPSRTPFWQSAEEQAGPLVLAEGIETAGALALSLPEARVWAVGSIAGFQHAPAALPCVAEIFLARDTNAGNRQAEAQIEAALERLEAIGKPVAVIKSHVGDDFNDLM